MRNLRCFFFGLSCLLIFQSCETPTDADYAGTSPSLSNSTLKADIPPKKRGDRAETPFDAPSEIETELTQFMLRQAQAWNSGEISEFMAFFWNSPYLRFASGDTVARGWPQIFARYKKRYPNKAAMGALSYRSIEIVQISQNTAVVHGQWQLQRANDKPWGLFTVIIRKIDGKWKITSDTTTYGGEK